MQKIIKVGNKVTVILENGNVEERLVTEEEFKKIVEAKSDKEIMMLLHPDYNEKVKAYNKAMTLMDRIKTSKILSTVNNTIYWKEVSSLSIPEDFAKSVIEAEEANDKLKLSTYKNFWTLMSLNTDEQCRNNLYWFLQLHGLKLAKCGFFVAYRNVDTTKEKGIYTDHHSHSTRIKIGEVVTIPREQCDCNSNTECSRGLHCASAKWLKKNYFGSVGLACLVNPADVVAVPKDSGYGKLRTCAYLPMEIIHYNNNDNVIPLNVEDGFDCSYVTKVIYEGTMGTEKDSPYKINIPEMPGIKRESIQDQLLEIAKDCIVNREL